jgi:tRNA dimethylallyltransferase
MAAKDLELPLVVIVGPTASGKSALALDIAKNFNGEIICADSRTVYKSTSIGTGKPTKLDREQVPHWGLNLVRPNESFSVSDYKKYADKKIAEIKKRGHIPFLVGGTGLYVDAVIFGYQFGKLPTEKTRLKLQRMSLDQLYEHCTKNNINLPENYKNKRYVIRKIENSNNLIERKSEPVYKNIIVGITTDKFLLRQQIERRVEQLLENAVVGEARRVSKKYGWENEAMKSNIYPLVRKYLNGDITIDDLRVESAIVDWHLAKRQMTWLRRNSFIQWLTINDANTYLTKQLAIYK